MVRKNSIVSASELKGLLEGEFSSREFDEMKRHTLLGAETLAEAERLSMDKGDRSFLALAREIALSHHEKWDGSGYPGGLKGEDIPLGGRLMALADVYDALVTKRVYKAAMPHEEAVKIILDGRGSHFDPDVVDAFLESAKEFREISTRYDRRRSKAFRPPLVLPHSPMYVPPIR